VTATNVTVTIDTRDAEIWHHCSHDDGCVSFKVGPDHRAVTVYLLGTIESVHTFAHTLAKAVAEYAVDEVERATIGGA
jgi:hypothetical protein